MKSVRLKNGSEELESFVVTTAFALSEIWRALPVAAYELVQLCKVQTTNSLANPLTTWNLAAC